MKIKLNPFLKEVRGKIGNTVFRLCHTGELQIAARPDMSRVKWSEAQKAHRKRFRYAVDYAKFCMKIPELRAYYLEMAHEQGTNRPFDEAVRHYFMGRDLIFEGFLNGIRKHQGNCAPSTDTEPSASDPVSEKPAQHENMAARTYNKPGTAGFADGFSTMIASSAMPETVNEHWAFASPGTADSMNRESNFYTLSTMYIP